MGQWLDPLLFFVADASAERNWSLAARAMDSFSACIKYGSQLDVRLLSHLQNDANSLLYTFWALHDQDAGQLVWLIGAMWTMPI